MQKQSVLIVSGEVSGDLHASPVVSEMKKLNPDLAFLGTGGELLEKENIELIAHIEEMAVMGFSSLPRVLPLLSKLKRKLVQRVQSDNVKLVILVDYPGFNLNLASTLKKLPNPPKILEYIAPQAWAWRPQRVKRIRNVIDHLAVIFKFEEEFFSRAGIKTTFVGHPLIEEINPDNLIASGLDTPLPVEKLLAILPGSRRSVMRRHLGVMLKAAYLARKSFPGLKIAIGKASNIDVSDIKLQKDNFPEIEIWEDSRKLLREADAAFVCSGTTTLEAALLKTPQIIIYKTSLINYYLIKRLIQIQNVGLVNIVTETSIVPELLQDDANPEAIFRALSQILRKDCVVSASMLKGYERIRKILGERGAAKRVAEIAVGMLD
ncbi:lipid-A-disaccharide synthase [bacterium]|nr:lipid-A-disaccharide synthase [bacterium]